MGMFWVPYQNIRHDASWSVVKECCGVVSVFGCLAPGATNEVCCECLVGWSSFDFVETIEPSV